MSMELSGKKAEYERNGYVLIRKLFESAEIERIRDLVGKLIADEEGSTGVVVIDSSNAPAELLELCTSAPMKNALAAILGGDAELLSVKPVIKTGRITTASPWHQDWPYWKGAHKLSAWIALDRADRSNGCLRVVPTSHTEVWDHRRVTGAEGFGNRIDDKSIETRFGSDNVVTLEMDAGDTLFFHDLLLHSSHPNSNGADRWSLIPTYRAADVPDPHGRTDIWQQPVRL